MKALAIAILLASPALAQAQAQPAQEPIGGGKFSQPDDEEHPFRPSDYRSPQSWAMEFRFGPYRPDVDSEFSNGRMPYAEFFGTGDSFLFQFELDYQLWHRFGSLGVGAQLGYFNDVAQACLPGSCNQRSAADDSGISIIPFQLLLVYRFDVLALRYNLPLVPYGKLGLVYDLWWITDATGFVAQFGPNESSAIGATPGYSLAGGLALMLDWIDPEAAVDFDGELGVNHSYLFFEVYKTVANGLWRSNALHVGDTTWSAGLTFEF